MRAPPSTVVRALEKPLFHGAPRAPQALMLRRAHQSRQQPRLVRPSRSTRASRRRRSDRTIPRPSRRRLRPSSRVRDLVLAIDKCRSPSPHGEGRRSLRLEPWGLGIRLLCHKISDERRIVICAAERNAGCIVSDAFIYILRCADGSYYTGITRRSVDERVSEHSQGLADSYTSRRLPVELVFSEY